MFGMMENDETLLSRLVFSDEAIFHLSGTILYSHSVKTWETDHPHKTAEYQRSSPKVNVFCAESQDKV